MVSCFGRFIPFTQKMSVQSGYAPSRKFVSMEHGLTESWRMAWWGSCCCLFVAISQGGEHRLSRAAIHKTRNVRERGEHPANGYLLFPPYGVLFLSLVMPV
jgi:hypothetical protein